MPLFEVSANIQESETMTRKRSHDEFAGNGLKVESSQDDKSAPGAALRSSGDSLLPPVSNMANQISPQGSPGLTDAGSSTPARVSPSPLTPSKSEKSIKVEDAKPATNTQSTSSTPNPPAKKKRRTAAEIEAHNKELAQQKKEREEKLALKAAEKAAEKAKADEEKAAKAKEREEKRKKKEEEDRVKADKKRKKEEEQQRIQDEKDRKARSQMKIGSFFKLPSTPKKADGSPVKTETPKNDSPAKPTPKPSKSEYEKLFHPFFVKENTTLAPLGPQMDEETRELKSRILDEHLSGKRDESSQTKKFDAITLFALPGKPPRRGKLHHPVKHIMEQVFKQTEQTNDPDAARKIIAEAQQKLAKIPMKTIAFSQDVRPPYHGTITFKPFALGQGNMSQVARNPTSRRLPLEYDYDSEAEWQEEEGEDIDVDDDEEELDDEDDMDGFLDDSEDAGLSRRIFANTMEPDSTGICFEDDHRQGLSAITYEHKMEFIHEGLEQTWGIDPFSTEYWEPEPQSKPSKKAPSTTTEPTTKMAPPPTPTNAFAALSAGAATTDSVKLVKSEIMNDVKQAILDNKALSKVGIIDFIFHQFRDNVSRAEVKNTLELVAEKKGPGRQKAWTLKPGHEIVS